MRGSCTSHTEPSPCCICRCWLCPRPPFPSQWYLTLKWIFRNLLLPQVLAVLDWELSTLGDPLADLAYNCMPYHLPAVSPVCWCNSVYLSWLGCIAMGAICLQLRALPPARGECCPRYMIFLLGS